MNFDPKTSLTREQAFFEDSSNPPKLSAGLEETLLKKQLPLRPQTERPTLKSTLTTNTSDSLKLESHLNSSNTTGKIITTTQVPNSDNGELPNPFSSQKQNLTKSDQAHSFLNPFSKPVTALDIKNIFSGKNDAKWISATSGLLESSPQNFNRNVFLRPFSGGRLGNTGCPDGLETNIANHEGISQPDVEQTSGDKHFLNKKHLQTMFYFASTAPVNNLDLQLNNSNCSHKIYPPHSNFVNSLSLQPKDESKSTTLVFNPHITDKNIVEKNNDIPCESSSAKMPNFDSNLDSLTSSHTECFKANQEDSSMISANGRKTSLSNAPLRNELKKSIAEERALNRNKPINVSPFPQPSQSERDNLNIKQEKQILTYSQIFSDRPAHQQQREQVADQMYYNTPYPTKTSIDAPLVSNQKQTKAISINRNSNQSETKYSADTYNFPYQQKRPNSKNKDYPHSLKLSTLDDIAGNEHLIELFQEKLKTKSVNDNAKVLKQNLSAEGLNNSVRHSTFPMHLKTPAKETFHSLPQQANSFSNDGYLLNPARKYNTDIQAPVKLAHREALAKSSTASSYNAGLLKQPPKETGYRITQLGNLSQPSKEHVKMFSKEMKDASLEIKQQEKNEKELGSTGIFHKTDGAAHHSNPLKSDSTSLILKLAKDHKKKISNSAAAQESRKLSRFSIVKKTNSFPAAVEHHSIEDSLEGRPISAKLLSIINGVKSENESSHSISANNAGDSCSEQLSDSELDLSNYEERQLGDGESSDNIVEEEETNSVYGDSSDDGTESYSASSTTSLSAKAIVTKSFAATKEKISSSSLKISVANPPVIKPAFIASNFNNIPPTLNFLNDGEKPEQLPWEFRKLLKWKLSPITPVVVKNAILRLGFKFTKKNYDWMGCFGKHMKAQCFKQLRNFQKLNHFPGSFNIGRKDKLWRNLSKMQAHYGKKEFNFFPQTYVLPTDSKLLKRVWDEGSSKQKWIVKPPASARGQGIRVISKWSQIPRKRAVIVQKYIHRPFLINDSKFDMRIYVYVSSYDPLRLYVYNDGLARFASCKYSSSTKSLSNRFMHLTNYSINKKNTQYVSNSSSTMFEGHKWSLKALWEHLKAQGVNTSALWNTIKDLIIKTIISGESAINSTTKANVHCRYSCHELFGFDILLDEKCKPWILEVNISPSLHSNSKLDVDIKSGLIRDMMNLAGFRLPDSREVHSVTGSETDVSNYAPPNKFCMDKRLFSNQLSPDERAKHAYFCQKFQDEHPYLSLLAVNKNDIVEAFVLEHYTEIMQSILDVITPDDLRHLCESIDEDSRKGNFQRLFPTPQSHAYLRYFEQARYYNLLLDQWVLRYNQMEKKGILLLQSLCDENIHLENPTFNPKHQWIPPNSLAARPSFFSSGGKSSVSTSSLPTIVKKKDTTKTDKTVVVNRTNSLTSSSSSPVLYATSSSVSSATPSR